MYHLFSESCPPGFSPVWHCACVKVRVRCRRHLYSTIWHRTVWKCVSAYNGIRVRVSFPGICQLRFDNFMLPQWPHVRFNRESLVYSPQLHRGISLMVRFTGLGRVWLGWVNLAAWQQKSPGLRVMKGARNSFIYCSTSGGQFVDP